MKEKLFNVYCGLPVFVGVFGVRKSIVSAPGECGSIADRVGEVRSMMSLADTDKNVAAADAAVVFNGVGVVGVVPIDVVLGGVLGIVPNDVIFTGVIGMVPVDTIVFLVEPKRIISGCCSRMVSITR